MTFREQITELVTSPQVGLPVGAGPGGLSLLGIALPDWLTIFSLIYILFLLTHGTWKWINEIRTRKMDNDED